MINWWSKLLSNFIGATLFLCICCFVELCWCTIYGRLVGAWFQLIFSPLVCDFIARATFNSPKKCVDLLRQKNILCYMINSVVVSISVVDEEKEMNLRLCFLSRLCCLCDGCFYLSIASMFILVCWICPCCHLVRHVCAKFMTAKSDWAVLLLNVVSCVIVKKKRFTLYVMYLHDLHAFARVKRQEFVISWILSH